MRFRFLLLSALVLGLAACDNTTARYSSDYANRLNRSDILILPASAEAYTLDAAGTQTRMYDYESHVENTLVDELQKKLGEKGYRARILHKKDLMENKTYREYGAFKEAFENAYKEEYKKGEVQKREVAKNSVMPLSRRAKELGQKLGASTLAFIQYNETVLTSDAQAVNFAADMAMALLVGRSNSAPPDNARATVALIDAENDKILWVNAGHSAGGGPIAGMVFTDEEQSVQHVRNSLNWSLSALPNRDKLFEKQ